MLLLQSYLYESMHRYINISTLSIYMSTVSIYMSAIFIYRCDIWYFNQETITSFVLQMQYSIYKTGGGLLPYLFKQEQIISIIVFL